MARDDRPVELPAVKTTIVGGRPPGCGKPLGPIPRGIEVLVKKAAVDPEFRQLLLEKRGEAAKEIGLALDPAEVMMLKAAPATQLAAIIARTRVHPKLLPAFLGRAAAVMLVALGAGTLGCEEEPGPVDGIRPDRPAQEIVEPPEQAEPMDGLRPNRPAETTPPTTVYGVMPDVPGHLRPPAPEPKAQAPRRVAPPIRVAGVMPDVPDHLRPPAAEPKPPAPQPTPPPPTGIRPDRPPTAPKPAEGQSMAAPRATAAEPTTSTPTASTAVSRGVRPDRPPTTKGIRPDKPPAKPVADEPVIAARKLAVSASWDENSSFQAFAAGLRRLADKHLPKHRFQCSVKEGRIHIAWKTQTYELPRPAGNGGAGKPVRQIGPAADGLLLTVYLQKEADKPPRPQTVGNEGKWTTRLDWVYLEPLATHLKFDVHYGAKTDKALIGTFSSPETWLKAHAQPDPSTAVSRGVRPDRPSQGKSE